MVYANTKLALKIIGSFTLGFFVAWLYDVSMMRLFSGKGFIVLGYRLHHSLYGLLFFLLSLIQKKFFLFGFGLGIIAQHALTDGLWFITKEPIK